MRKAFIYLALLLMGAVISSCAGKEAKDTRPVRSFLQPLQERDSVLIADQLLYGFELDGVTEGTKLIPAEIADSLDQNILSLSPWILDTVKVTRNGKENPKTLDIKGSVRIAPFLEGEYELPRIELRRLAPDGTEDTLFFDPLRLDVKTMPVDTATFVIHDIKGQVRYPVTFAEVFPWILLYWVLAVIIILVVCLVMIRRRKHDPEYVRRDPAHIVALRQLDNYRGSTLWAPEKQKAFYSGVTDTLRAYMAERFGFGAMEMTTAEIFDEMKDKDAPEKVVGEVKELFERADFVKFAKYVASDDENAAALPVAVRFVTETYQAEVENEVKDGGTE
ncbi:MAG: hypothetical protein J6R30_08895 [Bacteroidales bacterium]|nr:hypothetical protein [Bacteroidales bacterium]